MVVRTNVSLRVRSAGDLELVKSVATSSNSAGSEGEKITGPRRRLSISPHGRPATPRPGPLRTLIPTSARARPDSIRFSKTAGIWIRLNRTRRSSRGKRGPAPPAAHTPTMHDYLQRRPTGWFDEDAALWRLIGPRGCRCLRQEELLAHLPEETRVHELLAMGDEVLVRELGRLEAPLCDLTTAQLRVVLRCFRAQESTEEGLTAERLERLLVRYGYTFKLLCREDRDTVPDTQYVALYDERKTLIHVVCVERAGQRGPVRSPSGAGYAFTVPLLAQQ